MIEFTILDFVLPLYVSNNININGMFRRKKQRLVEKFLNNRGDVLFLGFQTSFLLLECVVLLVISRTPREISM